MATIVGSFDNEVLTGTPDDDFIQAEPAGRAVIASSFIPGFGDTLNGGAGDDTLVGGAGEDLLNGGDGSDTVILTAFMPWGVSVLLGEDVDGHQWFGVPEGQGVSDEDRPNGVDRLISIENVIGTAFSDDIVGGADPNRLEGGGGDDTLGGVAGDDTLVGGDGDDLLRGGAGDDQLFGGPGGDTLTDSSGSNILRGGRGDDSLSGGPGDDFISGDRGNDTMTGGPGADIFHSSQDAGIDKVLDFSLAEGDRVQLDPGAVFTVSQVGADTVIDMGGGNEVILVGVQMSTLPPGTIFLA